MIEEAPKRKGRKNFSIFLEEKMVQFIKQINDEYLYWDKLKYKQIPVSGYTSEDVWQAVKLVREIDMRFVRFGKYKFGFYQSDKIFEMLHNLDLNVGGLLGTKELVTDEDKVKYQVSSIMEEAIASSQIEGANTTRVKAKEMLRKEIKPRTKAEKMIVNNFTTIRHIVTNKDIELTKEELLEIHSLVTLDTLEDKENEGRFRQNNDVVVSNSVDGEIVHYPPDFSEIEELIEDVCAFFNNNDNSKFFVHPIVKGIIIHFMIAYIHPFVDGNGRTARALFYWYLLKNNYWLTEYLSISRMIYRSKAQYEKAYLYSEHDENDITYFINYNLRVITLAYSELKTYLQRKMNEKQAVVRYSMVNGINIRQSQIIRDFEQDKNMLATVKDMCNKFMVSNQTAQTDLLGLVEKGFLDIVMNKKQRVFIRSENFDELLRLK